MRILYDLFILTFGALLHGFAPFNRKARKWVQGRVGWIERLSSVRKGDEKWIWFHCSSLGEYEDFLDVLTRTKRDKPDRKFLLTLSSPSGYDVVKDTTVCDLVMYLPLDTKSNAKRFMDLLRPEAIFFSRSDLWWRYLSEIRARKTPAYLISLFLDENSGFLKRSLRGMYTECFSAFTHIFCQNEKTKSLLQETFGIEAASVTGNSRFDRVAASVSQIVFYPLVEKFVGDDFTVVVGSSWPKDENFVFQTYAELKAKLPKTRIKWIVVPHEIDETRIEKWVAVDPAKRLRYSKIESAKPTHDILFIDFVGGLKHLYRYADFSVIGGGFDKIGIHNIIEPATYGVPQAFGPNHRNYQEALDLTETKAADIFHSSEELTAIILKRLTEESSSLKSSISAYVQTNRGASQRIVETIRSINSDL
jgi:3-deoxy-D-manno-octulosonic-acid transferase